VAISLLPTTSDLPRPLEQPGKAGISGPLLKWLNLLVGWMKDLTRTLDGGRQAQVQAINALIVQAPISGDATPSVKATPSGVDMWLQVTVGPHTYYVPGYLSKTS